MAYNPKSLENLKPFEEGNPGGGRPKGFIPLVTIIERVLKQQIELDDPITKTRSKKELQEWVVLALITKAMKGDVSAIKELLERIDGKVVQKNDVNIRTHEDALKELE
jgi:hypothetical protein